MASVRKRGKAWQATVRGPDGKERTKTFPLQVDAQRWADTQSADRARGEWVDPRQARTTLADYAARWLERMEPTWRSSTAGTVRVSIEKHVLPTLGRHRLANLRKSDVEALCASLPLAPSTTAVVHQHLSQLLSAAVEDGLLPRNPASRARLPRREAAKAQPLPLDDAERIAAELPEWMAIVVPLGVGAGLRQGEVSGLTVDRVAFPRRTLRVDRQLISRYVPAPVLREPKTASSTRTIPLAAFVLDALADHLRRFPAEPHELVLRSPSGAPMDSDAFGHRWRQACKRAGVPGASFHALRHTFASTLLSRGVSVKAVADWLGHASPVVTLSTYAHLMPADEDVARAVLDAALASPADISRTSEAGQGA
jgi:integrase